MATIKNSKVTVAICGLVGILVITACLLMSATPVSVETLKETTAYGLLYVKHGRVGAKSEGPDYYLQTFKGDFLLHYKRDGWRPIYYLEFYCRRMVGVTGQIDEENMAINVKRVWEIYKPRIPQEW